MLSSSGLQRERRLMTMPTWTHLLLSFHFYRLHTSHSSCVLFPFTTHSLLVRCNSATELYVLVHVGAGSVACSPIHHLGLDRMFHRYVLSLSRSIHSFGHPRASQSMTEYGCPFVLKYIYMCPSSFVWSVVWDQHTRVVVTDDYRHRDIHTHTTGLSSFDSAMHRRRVLSATHISHHHSIIFAPTDSQQQQHSFSLLLCPSFLTSYRSIISILYQK